jgi:undecaprenyl-diphosphatase
MALTATFSAVFARFIIKPLILFFYSEARPFVSLGNVKPLVTTPIIENIQSFPSGHALIFFAIAMSVYLSHKKWGIFFFIMATVMGLARIFAGVHWPIDIFAGAIIGIAVGYISHVLYSYSQKFY